MGGERPRDWEKEVFYFPLEPRKPICGFDDSSGFFLSKKIPLRIVARLSQDKCHEKGLVTQWMMKKQQLLLIDESVGPFN